MRRGSMVATICAVLSVTCGGWSAATGATPLTTVRVASGLLRPVGLAAPPADFNRVFVIEKQGRIRVIENGVLLASPVMDINSRVGGGTSTNDERGLLGLAFHPDFMNNGFFYVDYTNNSSNSTISRFSIVGDPATSNVADPNSEVILLTISQPFSNHNGGWLEFGPNDGYLYIGKGDGGAGGDPGDRAQDITNQLLGKILRIDVDATDGPGGNYGIPPSNPFVGITGDDEIWAYGVRNPWRCAFDKANGDLYIADVGQNAWEEIDFQPAASLGGENYAWRCMEGNHCFTTSSGCTCNSALVVDPIHEYANPAVGRSITGGRLYRGCAIPDLEGNYFFADYVSDKIWSFVYVGGTVTGFRDRTTELAPAGLNLRDIASFGEDAYGEIYIVEQGTSSSNGEVFKIVPDTGGPLNDCNANSIEDACEILDGSGTDSDENGILDVCECLAAGQPPTADQYGTVACTMDTQCDNEATCIGGVCYAPRNRYLCYQYDGLDRLVRARVTHVGSGRQWWVGPVDGNGLALLQDVPEVHDAEQLGVVCVAGCGVSPSQSYDIQVIGETCNIADEGLYSVALTLPTAAWGDVEGGQNMGEWLPSDGEAGFEDILAVVKAFQNDPNAPPPTWTDLGDEIPNTATEFSDILLAVRAFQAQPYSFSAPADCP